MGGGRLEFTNHVERGPTMHYQMTPYTARERLGLWLLASWGLLVVNGMFLYAMVWQPEALIRAIQNPLAAAFMLETVTLLGVLAYLLDKWKLGGLHWGWFVGLALFGSLAFALPFVLLSKCRKDQPGQPRGVCEDASGTLDQETP